MTNIIQCISPIDGSVYAERKAFTETDMEHRLHKARQAQRIWAETKLSERLACVNHAIKKLKSANDRIVTELAHQMGRPTRYGGEIDGVVERADYMAAIAEESLKPIVIEESDTLKRFVTAEPVGLVLIVAPWNYPYLTAINTIVPALLAGNAVALKHASQTILVGERFDDAFSDVGLPDGLFQNVRLTHALTSKLLGAGRFNFVNFTGSVSGGKSIEKGAAGSFTGIGLELGGKDPAYVGKNADLELAANTLTDGAMFNSGQCCCGIERIYAHDSCFDELVGRIKDLTEKYILGSPLDLNTTLGPMAHKRFADVIRLQITDAIQAGAKQIVDLTLFTMDNGQSAYLAPQILIDVNHSMELMKEESFGPVVGIMKVSTDEEAIELMNDSPYGLTASIWTEDFDVAHNIGRRLETGTVFMNRCDYVDPALCWSGRKNTGRGVSMSTLAYRNLTRPKSYHLQGR